MSQDFSAQYGKDNQGYAPPNTNVNQYAAPSYGQPQIQSNPMQMGQIAYGPQHNNYIAQGQSGGGQSMSTVMVTQPGPAPTFVTAPPSDLTVPAILVCLFCFWPVGICAIIEASNAQNAAAVGDMATAHAKHRSAKNLIIASAITGCIIIALIVIVDVVVFTTIFSY